MAFLDTLSIFEFDVESDKRVLIVIYCVSAVFGGEISLLVLGIGSLGRALVRHHSPLVAIRQR